MFTLLYGLPVIWLTVGACWLFSTYGWSAATLDHPHTLPLTLLWLALGVALGSLGVTLFRRASPETQGFVSTALHILERTPPAAPARSAREEDRGLLTLENVVAYDVIDPFGVREARRQEQERAQWEYTQNLGK
ncbi:hypothetical protein [Deinococcus ficus]|uniref:Uncharacterized protein n=1 Tax=Deinococcus ficus TaxID=317577 RepID=A0A221T2Q8_9DEIO|nr:hypothetical protein [Deinococcus ficus]ASN83183.1 hypothetical protein DFI_18455 [Deinococcus ficus]